MIYQDYMGYQVRVKDKDGYVIEGTLISYGHGLDYDPPREYDTIGVQPVGVDGHCIGIPVPDIVEFEVLEDD